ncbi:MAG: DUF4198 domain-containing protein [Chitinophagaceae bacterium]|nr:DUF4198 domain-containing protein [Chitinophagaceae bacterium]
MKKLALTSLLLCIISILPAHEFWLHPNKFIYNPGDLINIKFLVGENYDGENWKGNHESINTLDLYLSDATDDLSSYISESPGDSLRFAIYDEGTYQVAYNSKNKFISLDPAKFLEYLKEDGLQNAIDYRAANNENDSTGKEFYQRSVKTIFQVGSKMDPIHKKETSLPLDIIPLQNPYSLIQKTDSVLSTFKVLFKGKPVSNQTMKVWHRLNGQTILRDLPTDSEGLVRFHTSATGRWMLSTVKMERLMNDTAADWQSYWGSCTWGFD